MLFFAMILTVLNSKYGLNNMPHITITFVKCNKKTQRQIDSKKRCFVWFWKMVKNQSRTFWMLMKNNDAQHKTRNRKWIIHRPFTSLQMLHKLLISFRCDPDYYIWDPFEYINYIWTDSFFYLSINDNQAKYYNICYKAFS